MHGFDEAAGADHPAHLPAGHREGLSTGGKRNGSLPHARQTSEVVVPDRGRVARLHGVVDAELVHLVRNH